MNISEANDVCTVLHALQTQALTRGGTTVDVEDVVAAALRLAERAGKPLLLQVNAHETSIRRTVTRIYGGAA